MRPLVAVLLVTISFGYGYSILLPYDQQTRNPYTPGIKTSNWKDDENILTDHNYSKVYVHNQPSSNGQYVLTRTEETQRLYPIYNAHSYGPRLDDENSHEPYVQDNNGTDNDERTLYKRKIDYKTPEIYEKCPSGATGQFVYHLSCNQYLNCWKGRGSAQNCAPGTLFNPKTLECDFMDKVECITGPRQNTVGARVTKSVTQALCPEGFSGLMPNYTDCSKFISCNDGHGISMDCAPGTLFNVNQNVCDHPENVECFGGVPKGLAQTTPCNAQGNCGSAVPSTGPNVQQVYGQHTSVECNPQLQSCQQNGYTTSGFSNCNPQIQNCGKGAVQGQGYSHSQNSGQTYRLQPTGNTYYYGGGGSTQQYSGTKPAQQGQIFNKGRGYGNIQNAGYAHHAGQIINQTRCNPFLQNCGLIVDQQGGNSNPTYSSGIQQSTAQGQVNIISTGGCDPRTQNCQSVVGQSNIISPQTGCGSLSGNCQQPSYEENNEQTYPTNVQTSPCNPQIQNCHPPHQTTTSNVGGQWYPINSGTQTACDPRTQNCNAGNHQMILKLNITGQRHPVNLRGQGVPHQPNGCDPQTQNCESIVGQTSYAYHATGQTTYPNNFQGQTTNTLLTNCNPQAQNCNPSTTTQYNYQKAGQTYPSYIQGQSSSHSHVNCDPLGQNCNPTANQGSYNHQVTGKVYPNSISGQTTYSHQGQVYPYNAHNQISHSQTICDPSKKNCRPTATQGQLKPNDNSHLSYGCDLMTLRCTGPLARNRNPNEQQSHSGGESNIGQTNYQMQNQHRCQPNQNCQGTAQQQQGNCDSNTQGCIQNYKSVCNVNDPNCRDPHRIVSKDTSKQKAECPVDYQGITKHPFDCGKFLNCANGQTFVQDCAPGTLFNPKINTCDFPYNVDCKNQKPSDVPHEPYSPSIYETTTNAGQGNVRIVPPIIPAFKKPESGRHVTESYRGQSGILERSTVGPQQQTEDPDDPKHYTFRSTTVRSVDSLSPYTASGASADNEYDNGEVVTLRPENIIIAEKKKKSDCRTGDFYCSSKMCVTKPMVCDGHKDCDNGRDEIGCEEYIGRFSGTKNHRLEVLEKQRWINVSQTTCALLCIESTKFICRSFNYRKMDKTCFLSDLNVGLTGTLRKYYPMDYYELNAGTIDCSDRSRYFQCNNKKCLIRKLVCDGNDDCGDREDEKGCNAEDFKYSVKLAGSKEENEGRIELTAFGKSGYICDDQFTLRDAHVVCKELGFEMGAAAVKGQSYFAKDLNETNTLYMMDDIDCLGNETTLMDCDFAGWGVHNCNDGEIAGVVCKTPQQRCPPKTWKCENSNECLPFAFLCDGLDDCADGSDETDEHCEAMTEIRLVNGSASNEGRVEISHFGIWGTICDDDFNEDAAKVVCQSLGYSGKVVVKKEGYYGPGEGPIWLDQVSCYGNESSLQECVHWDWGEHNCDHEEDVGVICSNEADVVEIQRSSSYSKNFLETSGGLPKNCGFRKDNQFLNNGLIHERVIRGYTARKGDYPWQAAIRVRAREKAAHWCGAIVISSKWVLTAAHCLQGYAKGAYIIVAGEYNTDEEEGTEQQKYIEEFFVHENFRNGHKMNNDIALVKLKGSGFVLNEDVQPICLPDVDADYSRDLNCTISGFGTVKSGNSALSHNMMAAWIPVHTQDICKMPHVYGDALTDNMICAGPLDGGVDACDGDSGGPLACLDRGVFTLYGLTSWGHHCGYANKPGVYVKVANYRKWIENVLEKHSN